MREPKTALLKTSRPPAQQCVYILAYNASCCKVRDWVGGKGVCTISSSLGIGADGVGALTEAPDDGVANPNDAQIAGQRSVQEAGALAKVAGGPYACRQHSRMWEDTVLKKGRTPCSRSNMHMLPSRSAHRERGCHRKAEATGGSWPHSNPTSTLRHQWRRKGRAQSLPHQRTGSCSTTGVALMLGASRQTGRRCSVGGGQ